MRRGGPWGRSGCFAVDGRDTVAGLGGVLVAWFLMSSAWCSPMERGQYEGVAAVMRQVLAKNPDAVVPWARLGSALSRAGHYEAALEAFASAGGTPFYELTAVGDHADALRELGRCDEAAELRVSATLTAPEAALVRLYVGAIDDRTACGAFAAAGDLAWVALAAYPDDAEVHAALADALAAAGEREEAEFEVLYAEWLDPAPARVLLAGARWRASYGDWTAMAPLVTALEEARPRLPEAFLLRQQALVATGRVLEAGMECTRVQWAAHESPAVHAVCRRATHGPSDPLDAPPRRIPPGVARGPISVAPGAPKR